MNTTHSIERQAKLMAGTALPIGGPTAASPALEPLAVRLADAITLSGFSRSGLYRMAARGEVVFLKSGDRIVVDYQSLKAAVARLPRAAINVAA